MKNKMHVRRGFSFFLALVVLFTTFVSDYNIATAQGISGEYVAETLETVEEVSTEEAVIDTVDILPVEEEELENTSELVLTEVLAESLVVSEPMEVIEEASAPETSDEEAIVADSEDVLEEEDAISTEETTEEAGEVVDLEALATEEAVAAEAIEELPVEEAPVEFEWVNFAEVTSGSTTIYIYAPENAFEKGTTVSVSPVAAASVVDAIDAETAEDVTAADIVAFDITFYNKNGEEVQPECPIVVTFENEQFEEADSLSVFHMEDVNAEAEAVVENVAASEAVSVSADSFSVYVVYTYHYEYDEFFNHSSGWRSDSQELSGEANLYNSLNDSISSGSDTVRFTVNSFEADKNNDYTTTDVSVAFDNNRISDYDCYYVGNAVSTPIKVVGWEFEYDCDAHTTSGFFSSSATDDFRMFALLENGTKQIFAYMCSKDKIYTAYDGFRWVKKAITVSFDEAGGSLVSDIEVAPNGNYGTLPVSAKTGYTFDGWFFNNSKVNNFDSLKSSEDHTLVAHWTSRTFKLEVQGYGTSNVSYENGHEMPEIKNSKKGSVWKITRVGSDEVVALVAPGQTFKPAASDADEHFHAKVDNSNVDFTVDFAAGTDDAVTNMPASSIPVRLNNAYGAVLDTVPVREGYTFNGWVTEGGAKVTASTNVTIEEDHTLTASWTQIKLEVTADNLTFTYDGSAHSIVATASNDAHIVVKDGNGNVVANSFTNVSQSGTYTVVAEKDHFATSEPVTVVVTVEKAAGSATVEAVEGLTYAGKDVYQKLVKPATNATGEVTYSLSENGNFTTEIPEHNYNTEWNKTDKPVVVYYRVAESDNYKAASGSVAVSIASAYSDITAPVIAENFVYDTAAHPVVKTPGEYTFADEITMEYAAVATGSYANADAIPASAWVKTIPTVTNVGSYDIWYRLAGNGHVHGTSRKMLGTLVVSKADSELSLVEKDKTVFENLFDFVNGNTSVIYDITKNVGDGELSYVVSENDILNVEIDNDTVKFTVDKDATTNGETITVTINKAETDNYNATSVTILVKVSNGVIELTKAGWVDVNYDTTIEYDGKAHVAAVENASDATVTYMDETGEYTSTAPSFTEAGTYEVAYKLEKVGYQTITGTITVTITPAELEITAPKSNDWFYGKFNETQNLKKSKVTFKGEPVDALINYIYYSDADCENIVADKNHAVPGTYYVKASVDATNNFKAVMSEATSFEIKKPVVTFYLQSPNSAERSTNEEDFVAIEGAGTIADSLYTCDEPKIVGYRDSGNTLFIGSNPDSVVREFVNTAYVDTEFAGYEVMYVKTSYSKSSARADFIAFIKPEIRVAENWKEYDGKTADTMIEVIQKDADKIGQINFTREYYSIGENGVETKLDKAPTLEGNYKIVVRADVENPFYKELDVTEATFSITKNAQTVKYYLSEADKAAGTKKAYASATGYKGHTLVNTAIDPAKPGYTFALWYKEGQKGTNFFPNNGESTQTINGWTNLIAHFVPNKYTVSFNSNGGSEVEPITVTYDAPYGTLPVPTRKGEQFLGWFDEQGNEVTADTLVQILENQELTAHWAAPVHIVVHEIKANTKDSIIKDIALGNYERDKTISADVAESALLSEFSPEEYELHYFYNDGAWNGFLKGKDNPVNLSTYLVKGYTNLHVFALKKGMEVTAENVNATYQFKKINGVDVYTQYGINPTVNVNDATVKFFEDELGLVELKEAPSFTEPGTYPVYFKAEKRGYVDTEIQTATVTINYSDWDEKPVIFGGSNLAEDWFTPANGWQKIQIKVRHGFLQLKNANNEWNSWEIANHTLSAPSEDGRHEISYRVADEDGYIAEEKTIAYGVDSVNPEVAITIAQNDIKKAFNEASFGLFFKDYTDVSIVATDALSGVYSLEYFTSATALTEAEVKAYTDWTTANGASVSLHLDKNFKGFVYARVKDKAGNTLIEGTDGVVVYTLATADTNEVTHVRTENKKLTASVNSNGNNVKGIKIARRNGAVIELADTEYEVKYSDALKTSATIEIDVTLFDKEHNLKAGDYKVYVVYDINGEENAEIKNETSLTLHVIRAKGFGEVSMTGWTTDQSGKSFNAPVAKSDKNGTKNVTFTYAGFNMFGWEVPMSRNQIAKATPGTYIVRAYFPQTDDYEAYVTAPVSFEIKAQKVEFFFENANGEYTKVAELEMPYAFYGAGLAFDGVSYDPVRIAAIQRLFENSDALKDYRQYGIDFVKTIAFAKNGCDDEGVSDSHIHADFVVKNIPTVKLDSWTYDGTTHKETVEQSAASVAGTQNYNIRYFQKNIFGVYLPMNSAPVNAGDYAIQVVLTSKDSHYNNVASNISYFTINKKAVNVSWNYEAPLTYNAKNQTVIATVNAEDIVGNDSFNISYVSYPWWNITNVAKNAGTYTATIADLGNSNYVLANDAAKSISWTINPFEVALRWHAGDGAHERFSTNGRMELLYSAKFYGLSAAVTNAFRGDVVNVNGYDLDMSARSVGEYTAKATSLSNANYKLPENSSLSYKIVYPFNPYAAPYWLNLAGWSNQSVTIVPNGIGYRITEGNPEASDVAWAWSLTKSEETAGTTVTYQLLDPFGYVTAPASLSYKIDKTAPTVEVTADNNDILSSIEKWFFKNDTIVKINAQDASSELANSGVYSVEWKLEGERFYKPYSWFNQMFGIRIGANKVTSVNVRVTDKAGNVIEKTSAGIVVYTDSEAVVSDLKYVRTEATTDVNAEVALNGNTIKSVTLNDRTLVNGVDYTENNGVITLTASFLDTLAGRANDASEDAELFKTYTLTVSYNPYGQEFEGNVSGSDADATTFIIKVYKHDNTVTLSNPSKTYDGSAAVAEATLENEVAEELVTILYAEGTVEADADVDWTLEAPVNAGDYTVKAVVSEDNNYYGCADIKHFTIDKFETTITAEAKTKTYGEEDPELTAVVGEVVGEEVIEYSIERAEGENVGEYEITVTPLENDVNANYAITTVPATLTIEKMAVSIVADDATKIYGEEDPEFVATVGETANEEVIEYALEREAGENVGEYVINILPAANDVNANYDITVVPASFTITKRALRIVADDASKLEGTSDPRLTATVENLVPGDSAPYFVWREAFENVGYGTIGITIDEADYPNYDVTTVSARFTIEAAPVVAAPVIAAVVPAGGAVVAVAPTPVEEVEEVEIEETEAPLATVTEEATEAPAVENVVEEINIEDQAVPEAAPSHCFIHWFILGDVLLYAAYLAIRAIQNAKELEDEKKTQEN